MHARSPCRRMMLCQATDRANRLDESNRMLDEQAQDLQRMLQQAEATARSHQTALEKSRAETVSAQEKAEQAARQYEQRLATLESQLAATQLQYAGAESRRQRRSVGRRRGELNGKADASIRDEGSEGEPGAGGWFEGVPGAVGGSRQVHGGRGHYNSDSSRSSDDDRDDGVDASYRSERQRQRPMGLARPGSAAKSPSQVSNALRLAALSRGSSRRSNAGPQQLPLPSASSDPHQSKGSGRGLAHILATTASPIIRSPTAARQQNQAASPVSTPSTALTHPSTHTPPRLQTTASTSRLTLPAISRRPTPRDRITPRKSATESPLAASSARAAPASPHSHLLHDRGDDEGVLGEIGDQDPDARPMSEVAGATRRAPRPESSDSDSDGESGHKTRRAVGREAGDQIGGSSDALWEAKAPARVGVGGDTPAKRLPPQQLVQAAELRAFDDCGKVDNLIKVIQGHMGRPAVVLRCLIALKDLATKSGMCSRGYLVQRYLISRPPVRGCAGDNRAHMGRSGALAWLVRAMEEQSGNHHVQHTAARGLMNAVYQSGTFSFYTVYPLRPPSMRRLELHMSRWIVD